MPVFVHEEDVVEEEPPNHHQIKKDQQSGKLPPVNFSNMKHHDMWLTSSLSSLA